MALLQLKSAYKVNLMVGTIEGQNNEGELHTIACNTVGCKGSLTHSTHYFSVCEDVLTKLNCVALNASRNIVQRPKHIETIQRIEHSAVVNACKKSGNSYY